MFCTTIYSAVESRLGLFMSILYEAGSENMRYFRGRNDRNFNTFVTVVHVQSLRLRGSVDEVRERSQIPSVMDCVKSDSGIAASCNTSGFALKYSVI